MTATTPHGTTAPSAAARALPLLGLALAANLAVLGLAALAGAGLTVDNAGTLLPVGVLEVVLASTIPLTLAIVAHTFAAPRSSLVRRAWTPAVLLVTVLSLGGLLGASDLTTGLALGTMHLVVGGLAALALPMRAGR